MCRGALFPAYEVFLGAVFRVKKRGSAVEGKEGKKKKKASKEFKVDDPRLFLRTPEKYRMRPCMWPAQRPRGVAWKRAPFGVLEDERLASGEDVLAELRLMRLGPLERMPRPKRLYGRCRLRSG